MYWSPLAIAAKVGGRHFNLRPAFFHLPWRERQRDTKAEGKAALTKQRILCRRQCLCIIAGREQVPVGIIRHRNVGMA